MWKSHYLPRFFKIKKFPKSNLSPKKKHTVNKIPQRKKHRHRKQNLPGDSKCPFHGLSWRSLNPLKWVTFSPSQKGHELKSPGAFFFFSAAALVTCKTFWRSSSTVKHPMPAGLILRDRLWSELSHGSRAARSMEVVWNTPKTQAYTLDKPGHPGLNFTTGSNTSFK